MTRIPCAALRALLPLVVLAAMSAPAGAQGCAMPETVIEQIRRGAPDAEIRLIDGPLATRLRAGISALVGRQVPDGGSYLIAHAPAAPTSYVVRFADGCATHHGRFPERLVRTWLDGSPA